MNDDDSLLVIILAEQLNREMFAPYQRGLQKAYEPFTGRYEMISGFGGMTFYEGTEFDAVLIYRWQTREDFDAFWHSAAYQELKPLRDGCGKFSITLVPARKKSP